VILAYEGSMVRMTCESVRNLPIWFKDNMIISNPHIEDRDLILQDVLQSHNGEYICINGTTAIILHVGCKCSGEHKGVTIRVYRF